MDCRPKSRPSHLVYFGLGLLMMLAVGLMGCVDNLVDPTGEQPASLSAVTSEPGTAAFRRAPDGGIPDRYIVAFRSDVGDAPGLAKALARQYGGTLGHTYTAALKGFSAQFPERALAGLARNPHIELIEQDQLATTSGAQVGPTWGLDRVDQSLLPLDALYAYAGSGAGVHAYIIDSGIRSTHSDFAGRIGDGVTFVNDGNGTEDCMGHGTHVSGTVGGTTFGVAKGVILHPVRVFGCSGGTSYSTILAAIDWVTTNAQKPAVANMSLGGGYSSAMNTAVTNSIASGISYAVAAGNNGSNGLSPNACHYSPASTPDALTVAASTADDQHAHFSNSGSCVDLYAPGVSITSASYRGDDLALAASGTSMAAPHVAGAAAIYLGLYPSATPTNVANAIVGSATSGKISPRMTSTNNSLLNTTAMALHDGESPASKGGGGGNSGNGGVGNGKGKGNKK